MMQPNTTTFSILVAWVTLLPILGLAQNYQNEISEAELMGRDIDVILPVGVTDGAPGASPTGGATYTMPIYVPPGTNGMEPSVSVNYNSQSGDGVLGWGWSLSAASAIVRTGMDFYHDGKAKDITYGATDRFAVDGQRLVLTSNTDYGSDGSTYDTENAAFSVFTAIGTTDGHGPLSFTVVGKDGMQRFYGGTTESRVLANNQAVVIWLLSRVQDPFGNYMDYVYDQDQTEPRLLEINYTGNQAANIAPYNKISFGYALRSDINETYSSRSALKTSHLLERIDVRCEGSVGKSYLLKYTLRDLHKSYLQEVQEFAADGTTRLNSTLINYGGGQPAFSMEEVYDFIGSGHDFYSGDFDGDGDMELLTSATLPDEDGFPMNHDLKVWGRDEANLYSLRWERELPPGYSGTLLNDPENYSPYRSTQSADMNGDGRDDIVLVRTARLNPTSRGIGKIIILYSYQDEAGYLQFEERFYEHPMIGPAHWNFMANSTLSYHALGDFNGDGKGDLLIFGGNSYGNDSHAFLYSPAAGAEGTPVNFDADLDQILKAKALVSINYDGDQATELMALPSSTSPYDVTKVYKTTPDPNWEFYNIYSEGYPTSGHVYRFGDFNGDGRTDILSRYGAGGPWSLNYATSTGFLMSLFPQLPNSANISNYPLVIADLNGDGRSDIFRLWREFEAQDYHMDRLYSRGSHCNFELRTQTYTGAWSASPTVVTDLNGDGRSEVINAGSAVNAAEVFFFDAGRHERSVKKIANGMGAITEFRMANLSDLDMHQLEPGDDPYHWPTGQGQPALEVIQALVVPDGISGQNTTTYSYGWGEVNRTGRGFIGFRHLISTNDVSNRTEFSEFAVQPEYAELVPKVSTAYRANEPGEMLSSTVFTYEHLPLGTPSLRRHLTRQAITIAFDGLAGTTAKSVNTSWDAYGNVTGTASHVNGITTTFTTATYIAAGPSQVPALPEDITVTTTRGNAPAVTKRTHRSYWQASGALRTITEYIGATAGITKTYTPHATGPTAETTEHYPELPTAQWRRQVFGYDPKFRFREKQIAYWNNDGTDVPVTTIAHFDPFWGKPKDQLSSDGLTTLFKYDPFGRLVQTQVPHIAGSLRYAVTCTLTWAVDGMNGFYDKTISDPGGADVITHHDLFGRTLYESREALATSGTPTYSTATYSYDFRGNVYKQTTPHLSTETFLTIAHEFDDYNRPKRDIHPTAGDTDYDYQYADGMLITTVTDAAGVWKTSQTDATGKLIVAKDDGGIMKYSYDSWGNVTQITLNEYVVTRNIYDDWGQQTAMLLMNGGTTKYLYDLFGQLSWQQDANGNEVTMSYDNLGRIVQRNNVLEGLTKYVYFYENGRTNNNLMLVQGTTGYHSFRYNDLYNRLTSETWNINGQNYTTSYTYNTYDRVARKTYPSNFTVDHEYASNGALHRVFHGQDVLFRGMEQNGQGRYTSYMLGDGRVVQKAYTDEGFLTSIRAQGVQDLNMEYDPFTGNMKYRWDRQKSRKETFAYDALSRLTNATVDVVDANGAPLSQVSDEEYRYDGVAGSTFGDLVMRSSIGRFGYTSMAVTAARNLAYPTPPDQPPVDISLETQTIGYTPFLKTESITETVGIEAYALTYQYGPEQHRVRSLLTVGDQWVQERIYAGAYELLRTDDESFENHYIQGGDGLCAIVVKYNGTWVYHAIYTDHLGSIVAATDMNTGAIVAEQNFDPWGRYRKPSTWVPLSGAPDLPLWLFRGFTGHEYVQPFALINMNGRMYDPANGRMLGVDNYVQSGLGTQGFNRYTYAGNNPLKYTDPSGDFIWFVLAGAAAGAYVGGAIAGGDGGIVGADWNPFGGADGKWGENWWKGAITGALVGAAVGMGIAAGVGAADTGFGPWFTTVGVKDAATPAFNILSNGVITANMNMTASWLDKGGWDESWTSGVIGLGTGMLGGAAGVWKNGVAKAVAWQPNPIKLQNVVTSTMNGFATRYHSSGGRVWNSLLGAGEGFYMSYFWGNRIVGAGGNEHLVARYISSASSSFGSAVPGLGLIVANAHYFVWSNSFGFAPELPSNLGVVAGSLGQIGGGLAASDWLINTLDYHMIFWPGQ